MLKHILLLFVLYIETVMSTEKPGIPKGHIEVLDQILEKHVNVSSIYKKSMLDFLLSDTAQRTDDLFINVLDHATLKNIIQVSKRRYNEAYNQEFRRNREVWRRPNPEIINIAFDMMRQSIYTTRFRLNASNSIRARFKNDYSYNIAIMVGNIHQIFLKVDNLYAQMKNFPRRTHFLWFLIIYEKILAAHVDVTDLVRRIFEYHKKYKEFVSDFDVGALVGGASVAHTRPTDANGMPERGCTTEIQPGIKPPMPPYLKPPPNPPGG